MGRPAKSEENLLENEQGQTQETVSEMVTVKLSQNVKLDQVRYKAGVKLEVTEARAEVLKAEGLVVNEDEE